MRPIQQVLGFVAEDADGVSADETMSGGSLVLDGVLADTNTDTVTLPTATELTFTSADDISGVTFTVIGTDADGLPLSEEVVGPNSDTATTTSAFLTVTGIDYVGSPTTETVSVGVAAAGLGPTDWWPLDIYSPNQVTTISVNLLSGSANYDVQFTNEDPFDLSITQLAKAHPVAAFTGATASQTESTLVLMRAVRVDVNSGTGKLRVTVTQQSTM